MLRLFIFCAISKKEKVFWSSVAVHIDCIVLLNFLNIFYMDKQMSETTTIIPGLILYDSLLIFNKVRNKTTFPENLYSLKPVEISTALCVSFLPHSVGSLNFPPRTEDCTSYESFLVTSWYSLLLFLRSQIANCTNFRIRLGILISV